jgi:hypothetical protein
VAPVFGRAVARPEYGVRSDDWERHPRSRERLFDLLMKHGCEQLVVLGGDYHRFVDCEVRIRRAGTGGSTLTLRSITTSGLYCPYEFANTDAEEFWDSAGNTEWLGCGAYEWQYEIRASEAGSGYTRSDVEANNTVSAHFERAFR